ncbi:MAG: hypothetical protein WBK99_04420, partial [Solirubrobacterales bacterium]
MHDKIARNDAGGELGAAEIDADYAALLAGGTGFVAHGGHANPAIRRLVPGNHFAAAVFNTPLTLKT